MENDLTWVTFLSLVADFAMIIVTIVYVVFTWHLVKITKQSFQCQLVPLIGIRIKKLLLGHHLVLNVGRCPLCLVYLMLGMRQQSMCLLILNSTSGIQR